MRYDRDEHSVLTLHNFSPKPHAVSIHVTKAKHRALVDLLSTADSHADGSGWHRIQLDAHAYRWYRSGGLDRNVARP